MDQRNSPDKVVIPGNGSFHFCAQCSRSNVCCDKAKSIGGIDPPFVLDREVAAIEHGKGIKRENFADQLNSMTESKLYELKSKDNSCIFYVQGSCSIYS